MTVVELRRKRRGREQEAETKRAKTDNLMYLQKMEFKTVQTGRYLFTPIFRTICNITKVRGLCRNKRLNGEKRDLLGKKNLERQCGGRELGKQI